MTTQPLVSQSIRLSADFITQFSKVLKALGLDPNALDAVRAEGTQVLPGLPFSN